MKFLFTSACLILSCVMNAQQGWWTWMHGSNTSGVPGSFGTILVPAATNDPPSLIEPGDWTDQQGNFWIFGGLDNNNAEYAALWKFNPVTNMWTWMHGPSSVAASGVYGTQGIPSPANNPGSRHGAVTWTDNNGNLWLFGGLGYDVAGGQGFLADLWMYNITTNMWTWIKGPNTINPPAVYGTQQVPASTNLPAARYYTNASWTDNNGDLFMFGGTSYFLGGGYCLNDMWRYNISTNTWTWMRGSNTTLSPGNYGTLGVASPLNDPPARIVQAKWKDLNGDLWLFGGSNNVTDTYNELWKYNVASNQWTWMHGYGGMDGGGNTGPLCEADSANDPSARYATRACWTDNFGNFWMFGGSAFGYPIWAELWHYDVQINQWSWVGGNNVANYSGSWGTLNIPAAPNLPSARGGCGAFKDQSGNLWLFGGGDILGPSTYNDIWRYVPDTSGNCPATLPMLISGFPAASNGCAPYTTMFSNTSVSATSYYWDFGNSQTSTQANPSTTYFTPGTYTVTLIAYSASTSDTSYHTITINPTPVAAIMGDDTICNGSVAQLTASGGGTYVWSTGATSAQVTLNPASNTTYSVVVSNGTCSDTAFHTVVVNPLPPVTISGSNSICAGDSLILTASGGGTYIWNTGDTTASIISSPTSTTSYTITASNGSCSDTAQLTVTVFQFPNPAINGNTSICPGDNTTLTATGGTNYEWMQGPASSSFTVNPSTTTTYSVTVWNGPCQVTDSITVNVLPAFIVNAGPDDTIIPGTSVTLTATGNGTGYVWSPATGLSCTVCANPVASPLVTTSYYVSATNAQGCTSVDTVIVFVNEDCGEIFIPNAFSPNGDMQNDVLYVRGHCIETFDFSIFDRWGTKVFETNDLSQGWDGTYHGKELSAAVFTYSLKATLVTGDVVVKKGNVSLIK